MCGWWPPTGQLKHTAFPPWQKVLLDTLLDSAPTEGQGPVLRSAPAQAALVPARLASITHLHSSHIFPQGHPQPRIAQDLQTAPASPSSFLPG